MIKTNSLEQYNEAVIDHFHFQNIDIVLGKEDANTEKANCCYNLENSCKEISIPVPVYYGLKHIFTENEKDPLKPILFAMGYIPEFTLLKTEIGNIKYPNGVRMFSLKYLQSGIWFSEEDNLVLHNMFIESKEYDNLVFDMCLHDIKNNNYLYFRSVDAEFILRNNMKASGMFQDLLFLQENSQFMIYHKSYEDSSAYTPISYYNVGAAKDCPFSNYLDGSIFFELGKDLIPFTSIPHALVGQDLSVGPDAIQKNDFIQTGTGFVTIEYKPTAESCYN